MKISDLKVMKSAAGYYIGRSCSDEDGFEVPYSRESEYFRKEVEAQAELDDLLEFFAD